MGGVATKHQNGCALAFKWQGERIATEYQEHPSGCAFGVWQMVEIAAEHQEYTLMGVFLMVGSWKGDGKDWRRVTRMHRRR